MRVLTKAPLTISTTSLKDHIGYEGIGGNCLLTLVYLSVTYLLTFFNIFRCLSSSLNCFTFFFQVFTYSFNVFVASMFIELIH